ncbi:ABC transporter permease [Streptomyces sp. NPDC058045]|uniref:ABC transporter permease n=1 Tax=Streptomyces sp. NPDC058045 TaxID=3346311 RepID=UPI0036ED2F19
MPSRPPGETPGSENERPATAARTPESGTHRPIPARSTLRGARVPWVRTRLRAAPGAAIALALLVLVTAGLAAAFPRAVDAYQDAGLRRTVSEASPNRSAIRLEDGGGGSESGPEAEASLRGAELRKDYTAIRTRLRPPLSADADESGYGVVTYNKLIAADSWLPQPSGLPARMMLVAQDRLARHGRVTSGRLPRTDGTVTARTGQVEAAVSEETARKLHIRVGSVIHLPGVSRSPLRVRVTGLVKPLRPKGSWWSVEPILRTPALVRVQSPDMNPPKYWVGGLLLAPDAAPVMLGTPGNPYRYWSVAPDTARLTARQLPALNSSLASVTDGPALARIRNTTGAATTASTELDDLLTAFGALRGGITPVVAVAACGAGTVAGVVLMTASGLAMSRRRAELALLRARGVSLRGLAGRLLAESAVVAVPAGAVGWLAARLALPDARLWPSAAAAATVVLVASAAPALRAITAHRVVRLHDPRADAASARPSRHRLVAELTVLVLAVGAVLALRRGGAGSGGLAAPAPALVAVIAALALVRLLPPPLRWAARPASRLRGALGPLALARAGRSGTATAVLPLLALLTALATAAFGGAVLSGMDRARDQAALLATGADARVEFPEEIPAGKAERLRHLPGVREAQALTISYKATTADDELDQPTVPLAGVRPARYAELARRTGLGPFPATALHRTPGAPLPALASPSVAERYGTGHPVRMRADGYEFTVRISTVREATPAVLGRDFLVVDAAGLDPHFAPTALLLTGDHPDPGALRKAAGRDASVLVRAQERERFADSPMQRGAERLYTAAVAAGAGFALLALLLSLARAAPERRALLARLRTMGLTRAQGRRLLILEALPGALLAALGGAATGWAAVLLLSPGMDLTAVAFAATTHDPRITTVQLALHWPSLLLPAAAVLTVTLLVATTQAWWTGRRGAVTELRAGDAP